MINFSLFCKSNHWPARKKKVDIMIHRILKYKDSLNFNKKINYVCNIILADDILLKEINLKFRKKNNSTDVLTFVSETKNINKKKQKICDIFVSADIVKKDAKQNKINFYNHLTHIIIHSFLHINGYDHKKNIDFNSMKKIEISVLNKFGIKNPYLIN